MPFPPAPGFRDYGRTPFEGMIRYTGNCGYCWSSTPMTGDVTVKYLGFSTQDLGPNDAYSRAYGFQLRCLSE